MDMDSKDLKQEIQKTTPHKSSMDKVLEQMATIDKDTLAMIEQNKIHELYRDITLQQVKEICKKYLYMPDDNIIDFVLSVYISNFTDGERLWSWIIAPPSYGKTEILRALFCPDISILKDSISAKTLFSGLRIGGRDPSLFKRINGKVLIIKDFTKILSGRPEDLAAILGQLRNAYDGYFDASTGADDKDHHYETLFSLLIGVTPAIDDHYSVNQTLGERFLTWRITDINRTEFMEKVKENADKTEEMRSNLKINFGALIQKYRDQKEPPLIDDAMLNKIGDLADITTGVRTPVVRWGYSREVRKAPEQEGSARCYKQFLRLGKSLALVRGLDKVGENEYKILHKVALYSIPQERIKAIELFLKMTEETKKEDYLEPEAWIETPQISDRLSLPTATARIILDDLFLLKILRRREGNPLLWSLIPEFTQRWTLLKPL